MNQKFKRKLAAVSLFIALATPFCLKPQYHANYQLLPNEDAFAECSCGKIYIGDIHFLESIPLGDNMILVEDERHSKKDPNMKIYYSCGICTPKDRNDVIEVLQEYERQDPSDWDRTTESMRLEWLMHNLSYRFDYQPGRTESVDLNNKDEGKYDNKILQRIFGAG